MKSPATNRPTRFTRFSVALGVAVSLLVSACSSDTSSPAADSSDESVTLTVSAAASLRASFESLAETFEDDNPGVNVELNFGGSGELASQITAGAPVDVAAFASDATMAMVNDAGFVTEAQTFATNSLTIVTKPNNPTAITSLNDLANGAVVALCGESAPCGTYASAILEAAGVTIPTDTITRGRDVAATLNAVTSGDAEAAIVYVTDATEAGDAVERVAIADELNAIANYPIAVIDESPHREIAQRFVDLVTSSTGQGVLRDAGFGIP